MEVVVSDVRESFTFTDNVGGCFFLHVTESALGINSFSWIEQVVVSVKEAVASEPSDGSAKFIPVESEEVVAFCNVHYRK